MDCKWYPKIMDIIEDSIIVYDTSALLNVYRYSLVSSKRILNHIIKYEEKIWLPYQVKKEFYKRKDQVRHVNLYKNLDSELGKHIDNQKKALLTQLNEYEKKRFSNIAELKTRLEAKFLEMNTIIKDYKKEIAEETGVYKDFILEVDEFFKLLLASDRAGDELSLVELVEVLKDGELRYRYDLPPGYEDKTKEGIDKFGDLIMWKEIIRKSLAINKKYIIFITNDTKRDWFNKNNKGEVVHPREELISEFNHYNTEKEIIIIPFENYIEEISDYTNFTDKELLLELRMNNLIKRLPREALYNIVYEKLKNTDSKSLLGTVLSTFGNTVKHVIYEPTIESMKYNPNSLKIENSDVIYYIDVVVECEYPINSDYENNINVYSSGTIYVEITLDVEIRRVLEDNETMFIDKFRNKPTDFTSVTQCTINKEQYIWGSDFNVDEEQEDDWENDLYNLS